VKRHALLIDAFAAVSRKRPELHLVLVGDGEMRPALEAQIRSLGLEQRVRLHGSEPDARAVYGAFDIVVQASQSEGLPNVLLEAASAARPIVATAAGGTDEIVIDGETGLLVPVEDLEALTRGIGQLVNDPDFAQRLGRAAQARTNERFGMDRFVREFGDLYAELATMRGLPQ
jgi:glycosyltransferase involved in cell wall biosynthesis